MKEPDEFQDGARLVLEIVAPIDELTVPAEEPAVADKAKIKIIGTCPSRGYERDLADRHEGASRMFAAGRNVVQVQRWLGHHSPSFTLDTYVHLLDADLGEPMEFVRVKERSSARPESGADKTAVEIAEAIN